jgi:multiple sugar transport system substrate-binding protein
MAVPGLLADLTDMAERLPRDDWFPEPWKGSTVRGRVWGIPDRVDPWMVYHNTDHFRDAGISQFPQTLDELAEAARRLTQGERYGWGLIGAKDASLITRYINFLYAHHGDLITPNGRRSAFGAPEGVAALRFYTDLLVRHRATQPSAIANGLNDVNQLFMAGRASMIIDGPWRMGTLRENAPNLRWSVAQLPPAAGRSPRFLTSSWYYITFRAGRQQAEAQRFVDFLLQPENMARSVVTIPARRSAAQAPRFSTPDFAPWLAAVPHTVPFTPTDKFSEIADLVGDAVQSVLAGRQNAEAAAADAQRRIDAALG